MRRPVRLHQGRAVRRLHVRRRVCRRHRRAERYGRQERFQGARRLAQGLLRGHGDQPRQIHRAQYEVEADGVRMHLSQYITGLLERFKLETCKIAKNPELTREDIVQPPDETALDHRAHKLYQEKVGALMFAMTTCRPDLAHAVGMLARKMSAPRSCDDAAATRVFRYC
jgi:hypothetical protein